MYYKKIMHFKKCKSMFCPVKRVFKIKSLGIKLGLRRRERGDNRVEGMTDKKDKRRKKWRLKS